MRRRRSGHAAAKMAPLLDALVRIRKRLALQAILFRARRRLVFSVRVGAVSVNEEDWQHAIRVRMACWPAYDILQRAVVGEESSTWPSYFRHSEFVGFSPDALQVSITCLLLWSLPAPRWPLIATSE